MPGGAENHRMCGIHQGWVPLWTDSMTSVRRRGREKTMEEKILRKVDETMSDIDGKKQVRCGAVAVNENTFVREQHSHKHVSDQRER